LAVSVVRDGDKKPSAAAALPVSGTPPYLLFFVVFAVFVSFGGAMLIN
jgi:hypothetical protein